MNNQFFAMLSRMKYIDRWSLMRNTRKENISEHSLDVGIISHALAVISNVYFNNNINVERVALLAIFHDTTEIITGDMPTPVKYYNPEIKTAYKQVESIAAQKLLSMMPQEMNEYYNDLYIKKEEDKQLWKFVKAADKLSALIKCIEEEKAGNLEFASAKESTLKSLKELNLKEADFFLKQFIPAYSLTLDELE